MAIDRTESGAQKARARALIIPREHGAWGLLLVPLVTGVVASFASSHQTWPLVLFTGAALFVFWLRTPVESLLGSGPITVQNRRERRAALAATIVLAVAAGACFIGLMWPGRHLKLLLIGVVAGSSFVIQAVLWKVGARSSVCVGRV